MLDAIRDRTEHQISSQLRDEREIDFYARNLDFLLEESKAGEGGLNSDECLRVRAALKILTG